MKRPRRVLSKLALTLCRAYIAASRRSDRGLGARLESARRASEIHHKRTGRALRVTEADVLNDEMYEEINPLPIEYRRLSAHLQTQTPRVDFDRRLLSYLSTQVATCEAVRAASGYSPSESERTPWDGQLQAPPQQYYDGEGRWNLMPPPPPVKGAIKHRQSPYPVSRDAGSRQDGQPSPTATSQVPSWPQSHVQRPYVQSPHTRPNKTMGPGASKHKSLPPNAIRMDTKQTANTCSPQTAPRPDSAIDLGDQNNDFRRRSNQSGPEYQPSRTDGLQPLTTTLPWESQQLFAADSFSPDFSFHSPPFDMVPSSPLNRRYSYNPNWRPDAKPGFPKQQHATAAFVPENVSSDQPSSLASTNSSPGLHGAYTGTFPSEHRTHTGLGLDETLSTNLFEDLAKQ